MGNRDTRAITSKTIIRCHKNRMNHHTNSSEGQVHGISWEVRHSEVHIL